MAIDKKIEILKTQQPQNVQTSTTGANGVSQAGQASQPINMKSETKSDPITDTIRTPEFQQLSSQEQLTKLKQLFPDIPEKDLLNTLNTVKSVIEQESENNPIVEEIEIEPENENEQAINKVAKELENSGKKNPSIDDVIAYVKSIPESERTIDQQKMLKYLNELEQKDIKTYTPQELKQILLENSEALDNLIPKEVLQSEEWQKKSPTDKLDARADVILSKMVSGYEELSEREKKQYRNGFYNKVGQAINPQWNTYNIETKAKRITNMAVALDAAEFSNMSIKDVLTADEKDIERMAQNYRDNKILASFVNDSDIDVNDPKWIQKTGPEQIDEIAYSILQNMESKYKTSPISEDTKNEWIDNIGKQLYTDWDDIKNNNVTIKGKEVNLTMDMRKEIFAKELSTMKSLGISPEEYMNLSIAERYELVATYEKNNNIELSPRQQIIRETIIRCNSTEISEQDVIDTLKAKENLTTEEQNILKFYEIAKEQYGRDSKHKKVLRPEDSIDYIVEQQYEGKYENFLKEKILDKHNISIEDLRKNKEAIVTILSYCHSPEAIKQMCDAIGIDPAQYLGEDQAIDFASNGLINGKNKDLNIANKTFHRIGKHEHVDQTSLAVPKYIKDHNTRLEYAEQTAALDVRYTDAIAKSWNNLEVVTTEEAKALGMDFNLSENVSNAAKSTFTKAFIETAANDQIRVEYGQELSKIDNSAVTEGLAAASNSVGEEYRSQYNSYVETAMQNYPPEQQANIRSAMKTGEISQETLSQTTAPAASSATESNNSNNSTNTNNTSAANSNNNNNTVGTNQQTVTNIQERTAASSAPANNFNAATNIVNNNNITNKSVTLPSDSPNLSDKTSVSAQSSASYDTDEINAATTQALQQKKEALGEKILKLKDNIDQDLAEASAQNEISEADIQTIAEILQSTGEISSTEEEKIRQIFKEAGTNITAIYSIIINKYGTQAQDKFLEILASTGSSDNIRSFVNSVKNDSTILKKLYVHCSNQKLKTELLSLLPTDDIMAMIAAGEISNLNDIDHKILYNFLMKNMSSMSNTAFASYLQYLSIDEREKLVELRNNTKGVENYQQSIADNPETQDNRQNDTIEKASAKTDSQTPILADNETSKVLNDGTIIRRKETFAPVSNNSYDEYEEVSPVSEHPSMNDPVLTPGSYEWQLKYNKQMEYQPVTQPTAMPSEEDGILLGSNKVSPRLKIDKMKRRGPFYFNA